MGEAYDLKIQEEREGGQIGSGLGNGASVCGWGLTEGAVVLGCSGGSSYVGNIGDMADTVFDWNCSLWISGA